MDSALGDGTRSVLGVGTGGSVVIALCPGWCLGQVINPSMSAVRCDWFRRRCVGPSTLVTVGASLPVATGPPIGVMLITSSTGQTGASRVSTISCCCAGIITDWFMRLSGRSQARPQRRSSIVRTGHDSKTRPGHLDRNRSVLVPRAAVDQAFGIPICTQESIRPCVARRRPISATVSTSAVVSTLVRATTTLAVGGHTRRAPSG